MNTYKIDLDHDDLDVIEDVVNNYNSESLLSNISDATVYNVLSQIVEQNKEGNED